VTEPALRAASREFPFLWQWDRDRYTPGYLRSGVLEAQVQEAVIAALTFRWKAKVTVIDSGDRRMRGRMARIVAARGLNPNDVVRGWGGSQERGVVDLAVTFPGGRAGWFECKKPEHCALSATGRLTQRKPPGQPKPEQLAFLLAQASLGAVVGVVWSPDDLNLCIPGAR
jgi:hypothetical protein